MINRLKSFCSIENISFALLCAAAVFSKSTSINDGALVPKQLYTLFAAGIMIVILSFKSILGYKIKIEAKAWICIIAVVAGFEAAYSLFQYFVYLYFDLDVSVRGHFDNPAGLIATLCVSLPFALFFYSSTDKYRKFALILCILIILAVVVSRSRTGMIISVMLLLNVFLKEKKVTLRLRSLLLVGLIVILIIGAYFINQDSADGRILIWKACWPLICDTPFYGNGIGTFSRLYMDYQAIFLDGCPVDGKYHMLAGNVLVPFNEYIRLYLNFGVIGLFALISIATIMWIAYIKHPNAEKRAWLQAVAVIAFVSLFSYPFTYPFTYIVCAIAILFVCKNGVAIRVAKTAKMMGAISAIIVGIYLSIYSFRQIRNEYLWFEAYAERSIAKYALLFDDYNNSPHFLYSYAMELYNSNDLDYSLEIAKKCDNMIAHYDLELLLGDIYYQLKQYDKSQKHFTIALRMCPNRFIPLESLHAIYAIQGDNDRATKIAKKIISKPEKVSSRSVKRIKARMKRYLENDAD